MNEKIKLVLALMIAAAMTIFGIGPVVAGPNPNKGKTLYKSTCKACHVKNGEAKDLTPISKTISQWEKFFEKGIAGCVKKVETKTGKALTPQELEDMKFFLVSHAADSDRPETCGDN